MPHGYVSTSRWHAVTMQDGRSITVTEDWSKNWQAKIAVRITSIVLWSLTVFSMIIAAMLISQVKKDTEANQILQMDQLAYRIAHSINGNVSPGVGLIKDISEDTIKKGDIEAIDIEIKNKTYNFGKKIHNSETLTRVLSLPLPVLITAHVKPLAVSVRDKQIEIFMIFSISLVVLGGFLSVIFTKLNQ